MKRIIERVLVGLLGIEFISLCITLVKMWLHPAWNLAFFAAMIFIMIFFTTTTLFFMGVKVIPKLKSKIKRNDKLE